MVHIIWFYRLNLITWLTGAAPNVSYDATIAMVGSWLASPSVFSPGNHPCHQSKKTCNWSTGFGRPSSSSRICRKKIQLTFDINRQCWFKHYSLQFVNLMILRQTTHSMICATIFSHHLLKNIFDFLPTSFRFELVSTNDWKLRVCIGFMYFHH